MAERWREIPGYIGWYEISTRGRVRSMDRQIICSNGYIKNYTRRLLKQTPNSANYLHVTLCKPPTQINLPVHVLVLLTFRGPCPSGKQIRHKDDIKDHNRLKNLCYGTRRNNYDDMINNGGTIVQIGSSHGMAKLTENQVIKIRKSKNPRKELAIKYGVSICTIGDILNRRSWQHV
jgi:hypothetical protein